MNDLEALKSKYKVVVWGFKPVNGVFKNTIGYVWNSFYRAFQTLGFETYWFPNQKIDGFDFSNCIFLAEGYDDSEIPLNKTSIYYVHCAYNPQKYVNNVGKFVDLRYNQLKMNHPNYMFELDKKNTEKLGKSCYYQPSTNQIINFKNGKVDYDIDDFDKVYVAWATNLMPNEMDENDIYLERENNVYFLGTVYYDEPYSNVSEINEFAKECQKNNIGFIVNEFEKNQLSEQDYIQISKKSLFGFDIRGKSNVETGYLPCRVFKNISYGLLGTTNSLEIYNELDGHCVYSKSPSQLFYDAMKRKDDTEFIKECFNYVKNNHTYVNRVKSILSILK